MAKITDPDLLTQWTEVSIDPTGKQIALNTAGNLSSDGVTLQALYSFLKEEWRTDNNLIKYPFPVEAITSEQFEIKEGWILSGQSSINLVRDGGWAFKDSNGNISGEYMNLVTLGSFYSTGDRAYYQQASNLGPTNAVYTGPLNQAIEIYRSGVFDYRGYFKVFLREAAETYDSYDLLTSQNISALTYRKYALPLSNSTDLKIADTATDTFIATGHPYTGIKIAYFSPPIPKTIGTGTYLFDKVISGFSSDKQNIYEKVQYQLRQNSDIDAGTGIVTGKLTNELLQFVGDTLVTEDGVFIADIQSDDINSITFTDVSGVARNYPFTSAGSILFNSTLQTDASSKYWMYFTTNPGGNFGTSNAIIVQDADGNPITGLVGGASSRAFTFNYDSNAQGGRTVETDADVTVVGIGLSGAQYVVAESTIERSIANNISLIAVLERNYSNL
jgi:hypothetical protein